jgi:hypothetical protein
MCVVIFGNALLFALLGQEGYDYGVQDRRLSAELAQRGGWWFPDGGGVDTGHKVPEGGGKTIAVLGCGV